MKVVSRDAEGSRTWSERNYRSGESVRVTDPQLEFSVDGLYDGIDLDQS